MNHPKTEEWAPYLYGESNPQNRRALETHLSNCPVCSEEVAQWRRSLKRLDSWKLPRMRTASRLEVPVLRWAFAGLFLLLAGFVVGRFATPALDLAKVRQSIEPGLRQEFAAMVRHEASQAAASTVRASGQDVERVVTAWFKGIQTQRLEDRRAIEAALERLETQRVADLAALKRELDILALNTDAGLRHTAEGLVQLASHRDNSLTSPSPNTSTQ